MYFDVTEVAPLMTNCYLIGDENAKVCAVVDPGGSPEKVLDMISRSGLTPEMILLTHGHYDHVGAVADLKKATGCKVYMDPADALGTRMTPLTPDLVDESWPANGELTIDELTFKIYHTPGHTPGSVCLVCGEYMFSGDTLFAGSCGRVDLPGGNARQMQKSLTALAALPLADETQVLPGHESFSTLGQERRTNPYIMQ